MAPAVFYEPHGLKFVGEARVSLGLWQVLLLRLSLAPFSQCARCKIRALLVIRGYVVISRFLSVHG